MTIPDRARAIIDGHVRLLLAWNRAINLTAIREPAAIAIRHVVDSLTALRALDDHAVTGVVDLGSGGGFPGLPLAAVLRDGRTTLVESVGKKARFLATVVEAVGLRENVRVVPTRAESLLAADTPDGAAVVVRGVAPLGDLIELAFPILRPSRPLIAWKSGSAIEGPDEELGAAGRAIAAIDPAARLEVRQSVPRDLLEEDVLAPLKDHRLVVVTRSDEPIDPVWPRDPAQRRRRRW